MPRSATDATRFTSTTPHASKPPSAANLQSRKPAPRKLEGTPKGGLGTPGATGETPLEKVRRLRAAADRARDAQISTFDKVLVRGRVWADRAHRFTALSLIAATFVAGGVTVYALGDMMIYNRKKRAQFFAEQKAIHANAIHDANEAISSGTATEDQIMFIDREQEHDAQLAAIARAKREKKGIFKTTREWLFSGLKKEESVEGTTREALLQDGAVGEAKDKLAERGHDIANKVAEKRVDITEKARQAFYDEKERQKRGGPLDQLGTKEMDEDEQPKSGGWTSFMIRK